LSITILFESIRKDVSFSYIENDFILQPSNQYLPFLNPIVTDKTISGSYNLNFVSEKEKVFIPLMPGIYHFFYDSVNAFISQYEKHPNALFIFDTSCLTKLDQPFLLFFKNNLNKKDISCLFIDVKKDHSFLTNNSYVMTEVASESNNSPNKVLEFFFDELLQNSIKPFRKVYVSRRGIEERDYAETIVDGSSHKNDTRVYDEDKLENFFKELGFDVVVPEDFVSFKDQLNYFYESKLIVSPTGGALLNALFMQNGSTVIEIVTSKVNPLHMHEKTDGRLQVEEVLHHFYGSLCWQKGHTYLGIQNKTRASKDIIDSITNTNVMKILV
jgi:hypothetical protein